MINFLKKIVSFQTRREGEIFDCSLVTVYKTIYEHHEVRRKKNFGGEGIDVNTIYLSDRTRSKGLVFFIPFFKFATMTDPTSFNDRRGWNVLRARLSLESPPEKSSFIRFQKLWYPIGKQEVIVDHNVRN